MNIANGKTANRSERDVFKELPRAIIWIFVESFVEVAIQEEWLSSIPDEYESRYVPEVNVFEGHLIEPRFQTKH
jgi:hypothetical protein